MANAIWLGKQGIIRCVRTYTVTAAAGKFSLTHNAKVVSFTATTETATEIATALADAAGDSSEGEWTELEVTSDGAVLTVTGPEDGSPFTLTVSAPSGGALATANEVQTLTFNAAATGGNLQLTVTHPNGSSVTTGNAAWNATDATWLANIQSALDAATGVANGIVVSGATPDTVLIFTHSGTGYAEFTRPFITVAVYPTSTSSNTIARTTTGSAIAPVSPHDVWDPANYSGGALPTSGDTLIMVSGSADMRINLDKLNDLTTLLLTRESGAGRMGIPDWRAPGYREYRPARFKAQLTTVNIYTNEQDQPGAVRLDCTDAGASTVKIFGTGIGTVGQELVDLKGMASTTTVQCTRSSVQISTTVGDTSTVATFTAESSAFRLGSGVTLTTLDVVNSTGEIACSWSAAEMNGGQLTVQGSATGPLTINAAGVCFWSSSGNLNNPIIGNDSVLDTSTGSASLTLTGVITRYDRGRLEDAAQRIAVPFDVDHVQCAAEGINVGRNRTTTIAAI